MSDSFRTPVNIPKSNFEINYQSPVIFTGSCFSDNIGSRLADLKFPSLINPFGVIYNPASLASLLTICGEESIPTDELLIYNNNLWNSFLFHGSFAERDKEQLKEKIQVKIRQTHTFIKATSYLVVTFGTSWVYRYKQNNRIVANCHKIPAQQFSRERLTVTQIVEEWKGVLNLLQGINPQLKIIFTVSPVRHLKDGAHGNQISKSILLLAIEKLLSTTTNTTYFPAYEIVNDELRDYRFYNRDMTHVAEIAVDYIFEKFQEAYFTPDTLQTMAEVEKIRKGTQHRILTDNQEGIQRFANSMLKKIDQLEEKNSSISFEKEKEHFNKMLVK